jgi:hypothetical protein
MKITNLHVFWRDHSPLRNFRTGVSLHSHTDHSRESMAFVPKYTANVPILSQAIRQQEQRYQDRTGRTLDFARAWWTPPLSPREAFDLERGQIETLDCNALVSLTDHDDIEAGSSLAVVEPVPVSVEWTVPFGSTFFHLGIHNLPPQPARSMMANLAEYTNSPSRKLLDDLLDSLDELDDTLIVLNHPMWDESKVGETEHARTLGAFLERHGARIHALELNGLRSWKENSAVTRLAEHSGYPLISGGDRHGCEPNAILNLTNAATFAEFVSEIRHDRMSDVMFMPQYREPLRLRIVESMWDIVRDYPERAIGRRRWSDRVFYRFDDGLVQALSTIWPSTEPWPVRYFLRGLRLAKNNGLRGALRIALPAQEVSL